jgi:hypothetical protein
MSSAVRGRFQHGDHICALYDSREQQVAVAVAFIAEGLRVGERCLYASYSIEDLNTFRAALRTEGIDAAHEAAKGALILLTKDEAHLIGGSFDCERMLKMLNAGVESALDDGYVGFRTCGDMTWLLDDAPGTSQAMEYEALVTELFRSVRALAMCQYDQSRLPADLIGHARATHTSVALP